MYDYVLRIKMPGNVFLVVFAYDLAMVILALNFEDGQYRLDQVIARVIHWVDNRDLKLASAKTEIVLLTGMQIKNISTMNINGTEVTTKAAITYLRLMLDCKLTFRAPMG